MTGVRAAWMCYGASVVTVVLGVALAARKYPQPFDWTHDVISALASAKHNPEGSLWFAGALGLSLALLWPVASIFRAGKSVCTRVSRGVLRVGLAAGLVVAVERLAFEHAFDTVRKGHELLALVAFLGVYGGVLGLEADHLRLGTTRTWVSALVLVPLVAIGISELVLYLGQRGVGWLDHDWRQADLPVWARFAFWQWLALGALWLGLGHLLFLAGRRADRGGSIGA